jgi:hypothetical protein
MTDVAASARLSALRCMLTRLGDSIPSPSTILFGSVILGALSAMSTLVGLYLRDGFVIFARDAIVLMYFYGAAVGFAPGLTLANLLAGDRKPVPRFIIGTIILFLSVHTATAALFALQYRVFYAHWHASFPSITWCYQLVFTSAGAVYQFTVDSLYIYYPVAPFVFIALGLWFAGRPPARASNVQAAL